MARHALIRWTHAALLVLGLTLATACDEPKQKPAGWWKGMFKANTDRKSTRLNSSHIQKSRMPSSA